MSESPPSARVRGRHGTLGRLQVDMLVGDIYGDRDYTR